MSDSDFTWRDDQRMVYFRAGVIADSPEIIASHGFEAYELLTTERAMASTVRGLPRPHPCSFS